MPALPTDDNDIPYLGELVGSAFFGKNRLYAADGTTLLFTTSAPGNVNLHQVGGGAVSPDAGNKLPTSGYGSDITTPATFRAIRVDTSGRQIVVGSQANAATYDGHAPILIAAVDPTSGAVLRYLRADANGYLRVLTTSDLTTPGSTNLVANRPNSYRPVAGRFVRTGVSAADKLADPAAMPTVAGTTGGSLASTGTNYYIAYAAATAYGATRPSPVTAATQPGGANTAIRVTVPQVASATHYDIFLSADAAPKWVGRITEQQRASGIALTAVGTTGAGSTAGNVDVRVPGTMVATDSQTFSGNNAFVTAGITSIDCSGYSRIILNVLMALTDPRTAPALTILPFFLAGGAPAGTYFSGYPIVVNPLSGTGTPLPQTFTVETNGAIGFIPVIDAIAGQGASVTIYMELC